MQNTFPAMRANMIDGQLRPNKVNNPQVLERFSTLERETFTAPEAQAKAYLDQPVTMGEGREMLEPLAAARMVQELELGAEDNVLVLAGGTGYTAAVLAGLAKSVTLVEEDATLRKRATQLLEGYANVNIVAANPAIYTPTQTYNAVVVDAPFTQLPNLPELSKHVTEGGKLAGVRVDAATGVASFVLLSKHGKSFVESELFETKGTPLPAFTAPEAFVF